VALALHELGVLVDPELDLDRDRHLPDVAFLDVWTPEVAPRVARLRAGGTRLSCLADLLLERAAATTVGVTGTAGKSTTTSFVVQVLRRAGLEVAASTTGRFGNLWPTEELVHLLEPGTRPTDVLALELTSSHLAFCAASPRVAVMTGFAPDHVELHGSLDAYRAAKERIVRAQTPDDRVVVNEDDPVAREMAALTHARRVGFSTQRELSNGVFVRGGRVTARTDAGTVDLGAPPAGLGGRDRASVAAVAAALALGIGPEKLVGSLAGLQGLPFRAQVVARRGEGRLIDDGMAATPGKAAVTLAGLTPGRVVAVVGGAVELAGGRVHASPAEQSALDDALTLLARTTRRVVAFGPAGESIAVRLRVLGAEVALAPDVEAAVGTAVASAGVGDDVVVCPMFPLSTAERNAVASALRAAL
jgi:UDP-N-acetylmuramoylalanine--D-glutamate ligase